MTTPVRVALALCVVAVLLGMMTGCQRKLFVENDPRTQFETHDRLRQKYVPIEEPDVFGQPQPALRARLTPPE